MSELDQLRRRRGCGCLGCLPQLVGLVAIGAVVYIGVQAILFPWIFNVGGRLRLLPLWEGWGTLHDPARGGDYELYVWFQPSTAGSRILPSTSVEGWGAICTPKGQLYRLRVTGGTPGIVRDMNGRPFTLWLANRPWNWNFTGGYPTWRPRLVLDGRWVGPNLATADQGSVGAAFLPDGSLDPHGGGPPSNAEGAVPITLMEGPRSGFDAACRAHGGR